MVNERRNRIPQPWLWVLAGAALVGVLWFVVAVAPSLVIGSLPKGLSAADELRARNDVRGTLVQALAGLAVAGGLVVTYRTYRQNRAEQDRTYERELYAKAVEQLGHEKAPVRLGALYSLERLAQNKPERRQVIVDVICAYLRMPFSHTPHDSDWGQERQVRITAQRILQEHLRDGRAADKRPADDPSSRFWPDIRLDLAGATLIDFSLRGAVIADARFQEVTFSGFASFHGVTFTDRAGFDGATFSDFAAFDEATFNGEAGFIHATFNGEAGFIRATFSGDAGFDGATFSGNAVFFGATFSDRAGFDGVTFRDNATFDQATINYAVLKRADFGGKARFREATFKNDSRFDRATFKGQADFTEANFNRIRFDGVTFNDVAGFDQATFGGIAEFGGATFKGGEPSLSFGRSRVLSPDAKHTWPTGWRLGPDSSGGYTVVRADDDDGFGPIGIT